MSDTESDSEKRKRIALQRWVILKEALTGRRSDDTCKNSVSVRRFQTFGLLKTKQHSRTKDNETWFNYTCNEPHLEMKIKHLPGTIDVDTLFGFNNTGNVCVWVSEEVLAYYCMKHILDDISGSSICELGGGMTCLAGVGLAMLSEAKHMLLTDGNEESVKNLKDILEDEENSKKFGSTEVSSRVLRWGEGETDRDLVEKFDIVICADCLFFDEGRESLVNLVYDLIKPDGYILMIAPSRGETFKEFQILASERFSVFVSDKYDDKIFDLHCKMKARGIEHYDENIHYPLLMKLTKKK